MVDIVPLNTTGRRVVAQPAPLREYHVLIPGMRAIGGRPIENGKVRLNTAQAQFWIDQGVIGEEPGESRPGGALGGH